MTIKHIIFDLGGVLVDWNPDYVFKTLIPNETQRAFFYKEICPSYWNEEQDAGYPIAQATADRIKLFPTWKKEIDAYYGRWVEMLGQPILPNVQILNELLQNKNFQVVALTNWSHETLPIAKALPKFEFLNRFEGMLVSGEEKDRKPFPSFFENCFSKFKINPVEAVFIDDNALNIAIGKSLGLNTIHFDSKTTNLKKELENFNIIVQ